MHHVEGDKVPFSTIPSYQEGSKLSEVEVVLIAFTERAVDEGQADLAGLASFARCRPGLPRKT